MNLPLHLIKRHPVPIEAHFEFVLVLTYAFPKEILAPLLPPGLMIDSYGDLGFVAIALVQTRKMRPRGWPELVSQDFFLAGHRIFSLFRTSEGRRLRGLRILRSDTDRPLMSFFGNLLTHYNYHLATVDIDRVGERVELSIHSADGHSDLELTADLDPGPDYLPEGSPFGTVRDALKFAGPLPFTFDYEEQTHSIVRIEGVRQNWHPKPVQVEVKRAAFLERQPFCTANPRLCSAFFLENVPYYWKKGVVEKLPAANEVENIDYQPIYDDGDQ
jgi:hypothetical protein